MQAQLLRQRLAQAVIIIDNKDFADIAHHTTGIGGGAAPQVRHGVSYAKNGVGSVKRQWIERVRVYRLEPRGPRALLVAGALTMPCRIGRAGATHDKREGDGKSPLGAMRILQGFWRNDRRLPPRSGLSLKPVKPVDGWCDAAGNGQYNCLIKKPFSASYEDMMRADHQYDVVLDLDWNRTSRRQGRGSAIFLHIMHEKGTGSAGCVTVPPGRINALMACLGPRTRLEIL